jgi:hypothetical protein
MKISQSHLHTFILFVGIPVSAILIIIGSININYYRKNPFTDLEYDIQKIILYLYVILKNVFYII